MVRTSTLSLLALLLVTLAPWADFASAQVPATSDATGEDAFLDTLPPLDLPEVLEPIPGAVNEAFRSCRAFWPAGYGAAQTGPEARAYRDIFSYVAARNVITSGDCSCSGKVPDWATVESVAGSLRTTHAVDRLTWRDTVDISTEARTLIAVAETMCGDDF